MATTGNEEVISMEMDPLKLENVCVNPWSTVKDLSEFLNYCCPECDYRDKFEHSFSYHALQNHKNNATVYFENNKIKTENEMESIAENHVIKSETTKNKQSTKIR